MEKKRQKIINTIEEKGIERVAELMGMEVSDFVEELLNIGGIIENLDLDVFEDLDERILNKTFYELLNHESTHKKVLTKIVETFNDVVTEGDEYYFLVDLDDTLNWFKSYRYDASPQNIAKIVFDDDYVEIFDTYSHTDIIRDIYNDLTPKNQKYIRDKIVEEYGNIDIVIPSDEVSSNIEAFATEIENGDYLLKITNENIEQLFKYQVMDVLFNNELYDLGRELTNLYNVAYNDAYIAEYTDKVYTSLKETFMDYDTKFEQHNNHYKVKITKTLPILLKGYLYGDWCESILFFGSYEYMINGGLDCEVFEKINFRISDYPTSDLIEKYINEFLLDYI